MTELPIDYNHTFFEVKQKINKARYETLKAVNKEQILAYLEIGKIISEKVKIGWGDSIIDKLSSDIQAEYVGIKGFSPRNLRRMKFIFEETFQDSNLPQLVAKLPWGHTDLIFIKVKSIEQRLFYIQRSIERGWSRSTLEEEIRFDAYTKHLNFQSNFPKTIDENDLINYELEFKPEHSYQLNWYLHLLDKTIKYEDDKPSIVILLCKTKSKITVEYALELVSHPMGVSTYTYSQLPKEISQYIPNEEELINILMNKEKNDNE